jgi:hypothetical protein
MAVTLSWKVPVNDCTYDSVYIYRSTSQTGTYAQIAFQSIDDTTYCDGTGSAINWYKIRFFRTAGALWSDYSAPMQGGTYYGYSSVNSVREINNLTTEDISDADLYNLIQRATTYMNSELNFRILREPIKDIDETRTNKIDGTNDTFYVRKWFQHLGDMNCDGKVTTSDIIVYQVDSSSVETQLSVSTISPDEGKFVLTTPPASGVRLFVTYEWCYVSEYTPHPLIKLACDYLTTAFAFEKVERGLSPQQVYGNVRIYRDMEASSEFHKRYREVVNQINSELMESRLAPKLADINRNYPYNAGVSPYGGGPGYSPANGALGN